MSYANRKEMGSNRTVAIIIVALIHVLLGYVLVSGLAYNVVKKAAEDLKTFDVEDEPPPPPEEPPPPPEDNPLPPPPQVSAPPPLVRIESPAPPIQTTPNIQPVIITPRAEPAAASASRAAGSAAAEEGADRQGACRPQFLFLDRRLSAVGLEERGRGDDVVPPVDRHGWPGDRLLGDLDRRDRVRSTVLPAASSSAGPVIRRHAMIMAIRLRTRQAAASSGSFRPSDRHDKQNKRIF